MTKWEYDKLDLNALPAKITDVDLLNDAGWDGWELVAFTTNNFAIMKRQIAEGRPPTPAETRRSRAK